MNMRRAGDDGALSPGVLSERDAGEWAPPPSEDLYSCDKTLSYSCNYRDPVTMLPEQPAEANFKCPVAIIYLANWFRAKLKSTPAFDV